MYLVAHACGIASTWTQSIVRFEGCVTIRRENVSDFVV